MSPNPSLEDLMRDIGARARLVQRTLRLAEPGQRSKAIEAIGSHLLMNEAAILAANAHDVDQARQRGSAEAFIDRLALTSDRLAALAASIIDISEQSDPVGAVLAEWERPNGLRITRVREPIGVLGLIFESRPNVAADASALALRSGNALIFRGGSEAAATVREIAAAARAGVSSVGLPADAVQNVATTDRAAVGMMLAGLWGNLDVLIPRGGRSLVERVQSDARVPVFAHLEGICHTYIHEAADPKKARDITLNAKMRRTSVCGATETLLIDASIAPALLPMISTALRDAGCALRGDLAARTITPMDPATEDDWRTEYLAPVLSIRVVKGLDEAIEHIARYGSQHTDCIITEDLSAARQFLDEVDSAIVLHNASTQFADGGEFGFGGEIGIATGRMHARGPVGAEQLTTFKYIVHGNGQIR